MSAIISLSETHVFTALRNFLLAVLPAGMEVVQTQDNGVPMPTGPFVAMNNIGIKRLSTNKAIYDNTAQTKGMEVSTMYSVQLDFYGPVADSCAAIVQTLFRDEVGIRLFSDSVVPLYADDPQQMTMINGEQQFEQRWRVEVCMQYNPVVTMPQQSATAAKVGLVNVDAIYPP